MASLNQCNFIGRVGKPPETRYAASGDAITNISIAVDDSYKDKQGNKVDKCEWVNVTFFGKLAEIAGEYLKKGSLIFVTGKMETRKFTDKSGIEKYATSIVASSMQMLGDKSSEEKQSKPASAGTGFDDMDDDINF